MKQSLLRRTLQPLTTIEHVGPGKKASGWMRAAKELLVASKEFACENRWVSWWHLGSTLAALTALLTIAMGDFPWILRGASSLTAGLLIVRMFIIYHDYQHRAILKDSWFAAVILTLYGLITLNPPSVWNRSHDHHHKHNSKSFGANIGSYPLMTTHDYASASSMERLVYAATRHPLNMLFGYLTVFLWGMSLRPFVLNPRKHFDGALAILLHFGLMTHLLSVGIHVMILGMVVPFFVSYSLGAYLFYAQHNYPSARLKPRAEWSHVEAALHSSGFITMGWPMNWLTGNIGYHHVHHLNARIPFYRLPEAMSSLEELQSPGITSLRPCDIAACLRLKLWNPEQERLVDFAGV